MGLTIGTLEHHSLGTLTAVSTTITFDSSYENNGEELLPKALGLGSLVFLAIIQCEDGYVFKWDRANNKILVYESSATNIPLTQIGADNLSAVVCDIFAIGR